jgi:hypothetical protein
MIDEVEELGLLRREPNPRDVSRSARQVGSGALFYFRFEGRWMRALPAADFEDFVPPLEASVFDALEPALSPVTPFFVCANALPAAALAAFDAVLLPSVVPAAEAAFLLVFSATVAPQGSFIPRIEHTYDNANAEVEPAFSPWPP